MQQPDEDALSVMKQAGQEFAEKQYWRHWNNEWKLPPEMQDERKRHWRAVKDRIGELVKQMSRELREAGRD